MSIAGRFGWRWYAGTAAFVLAIGPFGGGDVSAPPRPSGPPSVRITSPQGGTATAGNVVFLEVSAGGVTLGAPNASDPDATAHAHVLVDRDPPEEGTQIPFEPGVVHGSGSSVVVPGLTRGLHRLTVVLGDGAHTRIGETSDTIAVSVGGPTLQASAAPTAAEGEPWTITVTVDGVRLVKANGDTSGRTGHLHFFIDGELPAPATPIPQDAENVVHTEQDEVPLTGLAAGDHHVWIVLGDGTHRPFTPYVADLVRVSIT